MTKERLMQYRTIELERRQISEMLAELENTMRTPKSQNLDGMPHNPAVGGNPLEALVIRHMELQERYCAKLDELAAMLSEIERAIETLPSRERQLIRWRYIEGMSWEQVGERMAYSWRQVHRIHRQALVRLETV